jgi:hypothetical protein
MRTLSALLLAFCTLLASAQEAGTGASVGGPVSPSGVRAQAPIAKELHLRNKVGTNGLGLCVFTSIELLAIYLNVPELAGLRDWMTRYPGAGWPAKVDEMIARICKERGAAKPAYLQVQGDDLAILELCLKTGRPCAVTYGWSSTGRYKDRTGRVIWIDHMVDLAHAKGDEWAIIDNNHPGSWEWMTRAEFQKAFSCVGRPVPPRQAKPQGWAFILLASPPPPAPADDLPPEPK